jgi:predicted DNA-binding transcriptional regulator YafY
MPRSDNARTHTMARNTELIRQWEILREIDGARTGVGIAKLAALRRVHPRTIRRDIEALCKAGFPLYDDKTNGTPMWRLRSKPFRALDEIGLSTTELCALYFSRTLIAALTGAPFLDDVERVMAKIERSLPAASRKYLDPLAAIVKAKSCGLKKQNPRKLRDVVSRAVDACLTCRRITMRYDSVSSQRTKDYVVEPLRLCYAAGGVYLTAWVPEYSEMRTFALERVRTLAMMDEHFERRPLPPEPFANSLGVHTGTPELVEIEIAPRAADYVREREWHRSQEIVERADGSLLVRLCVCDDRPLRSWIHSLGPTARVVSPARLAQDIADEIEQTREQYQPRFNFEMLRTPSIVSQQPALPLREQRSRAS